MKFTPESLVSAVTKLFELNHYKVTGPKKIHGAEVDLVAKPIGDPFGRMVYMEVTIEYVDNEKYGKDVGKLALIGEQDRDASRIIISSSGFSLPVKERAEMTRIVTLTYDELFKKFEKFEPYISLFGLESSIGQELSKFIGFYEPPYFSDSFGSEPAIDFLNNWKNDKSSKNRWIVITGEYGTGKTALTKVLHFNWLNEYKNNPQLPIPFRIELRNFVRQFDARGLIHHFLDNNNLSHIPVDFVESLIRSGRVVLILDGYDEMAQYFNSRERRQCLAALASLSAEGAKGILTSRPNYFTITEELQVFEALYSTIKSSHYTNTVSSSFLDREQDIDKLLSDFLDKYERNLRDLTPEQTSALISRMLFDDPVGLSKIQNILAKIFRNSDGDTISLSGKPVIVSYLLEVVEQLKKQPTTTSDESATLSEWQVYKLIIDQLMMRDLDRSPDINPDVRRHFLQKLALFLSRKENAVIFEEDFKDLVAQEFRRDINRFSGDSRIEALSRYFSDLRSSTTLTRHLSRQDEGWRFSHNSIREYLIAEYLIRKTAKGEFTNENVTITDAMQTFAASIDPAEIVRIFSSIQSIWRNPEFLGSAKGQLLCLMWRAFHQIPTQFENPVRNILTKLSSIGNGFQDVCITNLPLSTIDSPTVFSDVSFQKVKMSEIILDYGDLKNTDFSSAELDSVSMKNADLSGANFSKTILIDINLVGANIDRADFREIDKASTSIIVSSPDWPHEKRLIGDDAVGYLKYHDAQTDFVSDYYVYSNHKNFEIIYKIITNLTKQAQRQRRGLEQRGAAHADVPFARAFIEYILNKSLIYTPKNRKDIVEPTENGRHVFQDFTDAKIMHPTLIDFLQSN